MDTSPLAECFFRQSWAMPLGLSFLITGSRTLWLIMMVARVYTCTWHGWSFVSNGSLHKDCSHRPQLVFSDLVIVRGIGF